MLDSTLNAQEICWIIGYGGTSLMYEKNYNKQRRIFGAVELMPWNLISRELMPWNWISRELMP